VLWIEGMNVVLLVQGGGEMAVMPAVIAVQIYNGAVDTGTDGSVDSTG